MAEVVGYVGRYSCIHCRERSAVEGKGLKSWGNEKRTVESSLFRTLKTHPDFIGNSPFDTAPSQRFTVELKSGVGRARRPKARAFHPKAWASDAAVSVGDRLPLGAERFEQWSLEQLEDFIFALSFERFILSDDRTATSQLAFVCNQEKKDVTVVSVFTRTRMKHAGYPAI